MLNLVEHEILNAHKYKNIIIKAFLACLDKVQEELLYYPQRPHRHWHSWQHQR